jgi:hypothetical protein
MARTRTVNTTPRGMHKQIAISKAVYDVIAAEGRFGEVENDVLERLLLPSDDGRPAWRPRRRRLSSKRMTAQLEDGQLMARFADGDSQRWPLPDRADKAAISALRQKAQSWVAAHGGTIGQRNAIGKLLTEHDYYVTEDGAGSSREEFLDAAAVLLREGGNKPQSEEQLAQIALARGLIRTSGKTPGRTMSSALYLDRRDNTNTRFERLAKETPAGRARPGTVRWRLRLP